MSKTAKIILIIAGALVVLGLIFCTIVAVREGGNVFRGILGRVQEQVDTNYQQHDETFSVEGITRLDVDAIADDIVINTTDEEQIRIVYYDNESYPYQIDTKGNALSMRYARDGLGWLGNNRSHKIEIWLPKSFFAEATINLDTTSGNIMVSDIIAGDFSADNTSGGVKLVNCQLGKVSVQTTSGDLQITDTTGSSLKVDTVSGQVVVSGGNFGNNTIDSISGDITIDQLQADKLDLATVSGEIGLTYCTLANLDASSGSGDIEATLYGSSEDYRIETDTVSGSQQIDRGNSNASQKISIDTISGNIDVQFIPIGEKVPADDSNLDNPEV